MSQGTQEYGLDCRDSPRRIIVTKSTAQAPGFRHGGERSPVCYLIWKLYNDSMSEYRVRYKSNNNAVSSCKYHVVWRPKYRRDVLVNSADTRLKEIIQQVCLETDSEVLEREVMPDHVHLLVEVDPQFGVHHLVKLIKGRSSRLLRQEFRWCRTRLPSLWTNSYFVSTVGGAPLEIVKQYMGHAAHHVEQQKHV